MSYLVQSSGLEIKFSNRVFDVPDLELTCPSLESEPLMSMGLSLVPLGALRGKKQVR